MKILSKYPTPLNLSYMWNGRSLLGFFCFYKFFQVFY